MAVFCHGKRHVYENDEHGSISIGAGRQRIVAMVSAAFGPKTAHDSFFDPLECNGTFAFVDIPGAEHVYHILMEAKEKLEATSAATEVGFLHVN